ncbi:MAG TPA: NAD-dependent epimerase/dehydratase family protein [Candidatus Binatia bacterium]|jgi:UDP-glucose 4-epimerase
MNILVTGGAGFIGSHLVDRLVTQDNRVVAFDNEATGRRENVPPAVLYFRGDVANLDDIERPFRSNLDAVCHIAGQVSISRSFSDPSVDLRTNVQGTINVLEMCVKYRVPRLLYASSMTVYSSRAALPTPEDAPCEPISYYGITKYAAERYVRTTAERTDLTHDFHVTCFRMYSVYGPRQALDNPYQGVLGIFLGNLLRGEPITIFGDGEQSRDFIYVDDIVDGWVGALTERATYGGIFNLGSGRRLTINQLADFALSAFQHTRSDYPVIYAPARSGDQREVQADVARAYAAFGWQPKVPFDAGLAETVRWALRQSREHDSQKSSAKSL